MLTATLFALLCMYSILTALVFTGLFTDILILMFIFKINKTSSKIILKYYNDHLQSPASLFESS